MTRRFLAAILALGLALAVSACGDAIGDGYELGPPGGGGPGGGGGGGGVTPGGAQDIGYARDIIANGGVPQATDIPVEGLLSEHDLPTTGAPCEDLLCIRPALGVAPSLELGTQSYWIQVGMLTGLAQPLERPPIDLVVVIDRSSWMSIDIAETNEAVSRLIEKMTPEDRLAVLYFNDTTQLLHPLEPVTDAQALINQVQAIEATGSWNYMPAIQEAYLMLNEAGNDPNRMRRVAFLTCGYPPIQKNGDGQFTDEFSQIVQSGASQRIGMTILGVILGWDANVSEMLGKTRGGSYSYLETLEKVETVFDDDLNYLLTPVAYDLSMSINPGARFELERTFGIPGDAAGVPASSIQVATAFTSRRRGAIFARLELVHDSEPDEGCADVSLAYTPESAHGWTGDFSATEHIAQPGNEDDHYESLGVRKGVFLINQAERMAAACGEYHAGHVDEALAILEELHAYMTAENADMAEEPLETEIALVAQLIENMQ